MSKMHGPKECFTPIREDASQVIVSYEMVADGEDNAFWHEVYFNKNRVAMPTLNQIKEAIIADIDAQTDEKILNGYEFTPDGAETPIVVWLSAESQRNFSEAQRLEIVPIKFKLNEDAETKEPIYHTFETLEELNRFYIGGVQYINQCLNEGWQRKDSIDWCPYEQSLS